MLSSTFAWNMSYNPICERKIQPQQIEKSNERQRFIVHEIFVFPFSLPVFDS